MAQSKMTWMKQTWRIDWEAKKLDIPEFHSKNMKLIHFKRIFLYFPSFIETISRYLCSCDMIKARDTRGSLVRLSSEWSSMYEEVLLDFGNTLDKVLQSPSQDRILYIYYYQKSDFFFFFFFLLLCAI